MVTELGKFISEQLAKLPEDHPDRVFLQGMMMQADGYLAARSAMAVNPIAPDVEVDDTPPESPRSRVSSRRGSKAVQPSVISSLKEASRREPLLVELGKPFTFKPDLSGSSSRGTEYYSHAITLDVVPLNISGVGPAQFKVYQPKDAEFWAKDFGGQFTSNFPFGRPNTFKGVEMLFLSLEIPDENEQFRAELRILDSKLFGQLRYGYSNGRHVSMYTWEPRGQNREYHYTLFPKEPAIFDQLNWVITRT